MEFVFIYGLYDPREPTELRYIGKSNNPAFRFYGHLNEKELLIETHKTRWIRSLLNSGVIPYLALLQLVPKNQWQLFETKWIRLARQMGMRLTNSTDGGEGGTNLSPESRQKVSAFNKGKTVSPETRRKMSEVTKRVWAEGRHPINVSDEARAKMSKASRERIITDTTRKKLSEKVKEAWRDGKYGETFKKNQAAAMEKARAEGKYTKKHKPETIQKMKESAKRRWAGNIAARENLSKKQKESWQKGRYDFQKVKGWGKHA